VIEVFDPYTLEWYGDRTRRFVDWCTAQGIGSPSDLRSSDLEQFVLHCRRQGFAPNTVHGYAQVLKTLCRLGHRLGYIPEDITMSFELPRVPRTIVPTLSDEQLQGVLAAPDRRTWLGIRDRAILIVLLDTLIRVSELVGLDAKDVDLDESLLRVMGKGRKEREVPFGRTAAHALRRYRGVVEDLRPGDPFFITRYGRRTSRWAIQQMMAHCGRAAGVEGVRCSPHTLRHTGAKRFILAGGDVFTLQKLLGHTTLVMVRRYADTWSSRIRTSGPSIIGSARLTHCYGGRAPRETESRSVQWEPPRFDGVVDGPAIDHWSEQND
jgi:integrase/recombinase XerD